MGRRVAQWERVLFELRGRREGVTTSFIRGMDPPIANPSQRIAELEARGHVISSTPVTRPGHATIALYRLEHDAERTVVGASSGGGVSLPEPFVSEDSDPLPVGTPTTAPVQPLADTESTRDGERFETLLAQLGRPSMFDPYSEAA